MEHWGSTYEPRRVGVEGVFSDGHAEGRVVHVLPLLALGSIAVPETSVDHCDIGIVRSLGKPTPHRRQQHHDRDDREHHEHHSEHGGGDQHQRDDVHT